jgi:hypothetical protein
MHSIHRLHCIISYDYRNKQLFALIILTFGSLFYLNSTYHCHALSARLLEGQSTTTICARREKRRDDKLNFYYYQYIQNVAVYIDYSQLLTHIHYLINSS